MNKQAKAIMALIVSAVGVGAAVFGLDEGIGQQIVAIATPIVTYGVTWFIPNAV